MKLELTPDDTGAALRIPAELIPAEDPLRALLLLASSSLLSSEKRDRPLPLDIGRGAVRDAVEEAG